MESISYVLVDGENVDWALSSLLGRKPTSPDRPRWERVLEFAAARSGGVVRGLFFLNASSGEFSLPFAQALLAIGFRPIPLAGEGKVVDIAIKRTLQVLGDRPGDIVLLSHDGDFAPDVEMLLDTGHRVRLLIFTELLSGKLAALEARGLELADLEHDGGAFQYALPRLRIIPIEDFNPEIYLAGDSERWAH